MSVENSLPIPDIATGSQDGTVIVNRAGKPPQVLKGHRDCVHSLSFCPTNPKVLASASEAATVVIWDLEKGSKIKTLSFLDGLNSVAWSCDGQSIAAACWDFKCYLFDAGNDYRQMCVLEGHSAGVRSVAWHPQRPELCATTCNEGTVRVWRLATDSQPPQCLKVLKHGKCVPCCCWLPDNRLASGADDKIVRLWNVEDGTEVARFEHNDWVVCVAVSPNGSMIASGSEARTCRIWEAKMGGKMLLELKHAHVVSAVTFTSDALHVVTGCYDATVRVFSLALGKVVAELGATGRAIRSVAVPSAVIAAGSSSTASVPTSKAAAVGGASQRAPGGDLSDLDL